MRLIAVVDGPLLQNMEEDIESSDDPLHSDNSASPNNSALYQTACKNCQYLNQEAHKNNNFTLEVSDDDTEGDEINYNKKSTQEYAENQNSRKFEIIQTNKG